MLQALILNTDKKTTNLSRVELRNSDKGEILESFILNPDGTPYDLSGKSVIFNENKDGDKFVSDSNVTIVDANSGHVTYQVHDQVHSASGTAWFDIIDSSGAKIDSTSDFYIEVRDGLNCTVYNTTYIADFENLKQQMDSLIAQANSELQIDNAKIDQLKASVRQVDWNTFARRTDNGGGVNLLPNTSTFILYSTGYYGDSNAHNGIFFETKSSHTSDVNGNLIKTKVAHIGADKAKNGSLNIPGGVYLPAGTYTLSFLARTGGVDYSPTLSFGLYSDWTDSHGGLPIGMSDAVNNIWGNHQITFSVPESHYHTALRIQQFDDTPVPWGSLFFANLKLESGSIATDWCQSYLDFDRLDGSQDPVDSPDFNALTNTGTYMITQPDHGNNYPSANGGILKVDNASGPRIEQTYYEEADTAHVWHRQYIDNTWKAWKQITNADDLITTEQQLTAAINSNSGSIASLNNSQIDVRNHTDYRYPTDQAWNTAVNLNSDPYLDTGIYQLHNCALINGPYADTSSPHWGYINVIKYDNNIVVQSLFGGNEFYGRMIFKGNNSYPSWTKYATTDQVTQSVSDVTNTLQAVANNLNMLKNRVDYETPAGTISNQTVDFNNYLETGILRVENCMIQNGPYKIGVNVDKEIAHTIFLKVTHLDDDTVYQTVYEGDDLYGRKLMNTSGQWSGQWHKYTNTPI